MRSAWRLTRCGLTSSPRETASSSVVKCGQAKNAFSLDGERGVCPKSTRLVLPHSDGQEADSTLAGRLTQRRRTMGSAASSLAEGASAVLALADVSAGRANQVVYASVAFRVGR